MTTEEISRFYDGMTEALSIVRNRHHAILATLKNICESVGSPRVLDLGCGTGITSVYMARCGATVDAVDISPANIARAKLINAHERVRYRHGDATDFCGEKPYDVICLCDVFEHIPSGKLPALLGTIRANSHRNTVIYASVPNGEYIEWTRERFPERLQIVDEAHSIPEMIEYFSRIGFTVFQISTRSVENVAQYVDYIFVKKERLWSLFEENA